MYPISLGNPVCYLNLPLFSHLIDVSYYPPDIVVKIFRKTAKLNYSGEAPVSRCEKNRTACAVTLRLG